MSDLCGVWENMTERERNRAMRDMCSIIACYFRHGRPDRERMKQMSMEHVYAVSRSCRLAALLYLILCGETEENRGEEMLGSDLAKEWKGEKDRTVQKILSMDMEWERLLGFCENKGIWYLPLEEIVFRKLYPGTGMRQIAEHGILFDAAFRQEVYGWFLANRYCADVSVAGSRDRYRKKGVCHFEMYSMLSEEEGEERWRLIPDREGMSGRHLSDEEFYLRFLSHAFSRLGSGEITARTMTVQTLLDCFVFLEQKGETMDWAYVRTGLRTLRLSEFERRMREESRRLFGGRDPLF